MDLGFKKGDAKWKVMRERALNDLYWFNAVVLGYANKFPMKEKTHRLPLLFAERRTGIEAIDKAPYQLILWPRETGKSSLVTRGRSIQMALRDPNTSIMIVNEKLELAAEFLDDIKTQFEQNELLRALFPEVVPPDFRKVDWSQTRATLNRTVSRPQPTFFATGVGGALAGKHPDHIVCDDLISDDAMENARSGNWTVMERVKRWVNHLEPVLSSSAKPFPTMTFIGTRWWYDDVYDHIVDLFGRGQESVVYRVPLRLKNGGVTSREIDIHGQLAVMRISAIENGQYVFPEIWPEERISLLMERDPEFAACNLLNDPSRSEVRSFHDDWLRYWTYAGDERTITYEDENKKRQYVAINKLYITIAVDPAASRGDMSGARNAIVVLGTDQETGKHFVLDIHADWSDPKDFITDLVNIAMRWKVRAVHIELAGQQEYVIQWTEVESRQRNYPLHVEPLKPGGRNKDMRIGGLVVPFKNGDIYVHSAQHQLITDEYRHYRPGAKKRDVLDALAYAIEVAPKPLGKAHAASAKQRSDAQLKDYYRRIGVSV